MNFMEAVKALNEKLKIRNRKLLFSLFIEEGELYHEQGGRKTLLANHNFVSFLKENEDVWEIVEEKQTFGMGIEPEVKTLSDKRYVKHFDEMEKSINGGWLHTKDVKQAIKEFIESAKINVGVNNVQQVDIGMFNNRLEQIAKEKFGDKLI